jgi:energy-coupling factor transporter ATP-binding protein EcfA2
MNKLAAEMSNGMRQRVGIARAFALSPRLLLLDEPFGMLDSLTRWDLQDVLVEVWNRTKVTAIMVTHDVDEAILLADRVVMMTNGTRIGKIMEIDRGRGAAGLLHPSYHRYRRAVAFLENSRPAPHRRPASVTAAKPPGAARETQTGGDGNGMAPGAGSLFERRPRFRDVFNAGNPSYNRITCGALAEGLRGHHPRRNDGTRAMACVPEGDQLADRTRGQPRQHGSAHFGWCHRVQTDRHLCRAHPLGYHSDTTTSTRSRQRAGGGRW